MTLRIAMEYRVLISVRNETKMLNHVKINTHIHGHAQRDRRKEEKGGQVRSKDQMVYLKSSR